MNLNLEEPDSPSNAGVGWMRRGDSPLRAEAYRTGVVCPRMAGSEEPEELETA
jgi:hypothetical protein